MASGDERQRPASVSSEASDGQKSLSVKRRPQDFVFLKQIGEGSYSAVFLAKEVKTGQFFAVKVLTKAFIIKERKTKYVMIEKEVLLKVNHPFFIRLAYTFQDPDRLYFVLNYARSGELLDYLHAKGRFDLETSRFYTAEIVLALEYLREQHIIHRDLKPENVLMSERMHILITDFGTAKIVRSDEPAEDDTTASGEPSEPGSQKRKKSFVGTCQYVSPEMLLAKDAYYSSDLWALGCMLFQFLTGSTPFTGGHEYQIFQKVQKNEFEFPEDFDKTAKDLVQNLLVLDPKDRLGCDERGGFDALKKHPFFAGIDFERLPEATPPLQPHFKLSDNFCNTEDLPVGLDDRRLVSLFSDFSAQHGIGKADHENSTQWHKLSPLELLIKRSMVPEEEWARRLQEQSQKNEYHRFVENNLIIKQGLVDKRKNLRARRRMFLLTEGPHLYYVDPSAKVLKGEIPWSSDLRPEARSFKNFYVHTPNRTYVLEAPKSNAEEWVQIIKDVWDHYYKQ